MTTLELLSPAKNLECGIAAIDHGADAVYIGATRFGARAAADNSIADIEALCRYAHQFGAKVYVTVNTLLYDEELSDAVQLCLDVTKAGADAILIQDLRLLSFPELRDVTFHASTQTDNRTVEKVQQLSKMGFRRVVLARELSISEIAAVHDAVPEVELEVFVHGALCVSYSGRCYASEHCFGRSANRGECAQFCRLPFTLKDADGKIIEQDRHLLSLKDFSQLQNLERLVKAGAVSFKIEGRLKDVDYVKNITAAYSQRLNSIIKAHPDLYRRASMGQCHYTFQPDIYKSFNRGFTTYFADGRTASQASLLTPKSIGEYVGKVKEVRSGLVIVSGVASFANGDGMCFFNSDGQLIGFRVNRAEGNRIFPHKMPQGLKPGMPLYRNYDQTFQKTLSHPTSERKIMVTMQLTIKADEMRLTITDEQGNTSVSTLPYEYQKARTPQDDNIRRQLTKLGGTIYEATDLTINSEVEDPFIPSSQLTQLRRETLQNLELRTKNSELRTKSSELRAKNLELRTKNLELRTKNSELRAKNSELRTKSLELGTWNLEPETWNSGLSTQHSELSTQHSELSTQHSALSTQHSELITHNSSLITPNSRPLREGWGGSPLMHSRYCIRHELGYCTKSGRKAPWREPLSLQLSDGRSFKLKFDCKQCEMYVLS